MAQGMDTGIGTNGSMMSGGQRQRLAIARALYRDARGLFLGQASGASSGSKASPAAASSGRAVGQAPQASPAAITLGELRCQECAVQFTDQAVSPAGVFSLKRTDLSVKGLGARMDQPLAIVLQTLAQGQGKVLPATLSGLPSMRACSSGCTVTSTSAGRLLTKGTFSKSWSMRWLCDSTRSS